MSKLTKSQQKVVDKLQYGDRSSIARELGYTPQYVLMVLQGKHSNDSIWLKAAQLAMEHDDVSKKLEKTASKLS